MGGKFYESIDAILYKQHRISYVQIEIWRMNHDFHHNQNYQKINEYQFINNMFFSAKKKETTNVDDTTSKDLELVTKMNHDLAKSLDLKETLSNSLELIIKRINAQAANIFLIDDKNQSFQCIASKHQAYLEDFEIPITQGVMGKAVVLKKCIRVGDVRKDVREIAEFYFDLDNKTNFTTYSCLLYTSPSPRDRG